MASEAPSLPLVRQRATSVAIEDAAAHGTVEIDDDEAIGFFAKGRDFENVHDAHTYTAKELELLESYESIEYLPPNNQAYRSFLSSDVHRSSGAARWVAM